MTTPKPWSEAAMERLASEDPKALVAILTAPDPDAVKLTFAAEIAGRTMSGEAAVVHALLRLLRHESPCVREGAVLGLSHVDYDDSVTRALRRVAANDASPGVREQAKAVLETFDQGGVE